MATTIKIFDPPMCCPTGVCGPSVDPALTKLSADLDWLKNKGVSVERYNLAQQPAAFAQNEQIRTILQEKGNECLPVTIVDEQIVKTGAYLSKQELGEICGIEIRSADRSQDSDATNSCCSDSGCC
ncbi:arsenite efflux transporter metallochaperone ArsD [Chitinispirillales bacterium ANBcel5]|uniref:arsenite efflux transporter metallochaperone ArsD n=1 Tax=Cellulosispirillum alkaliphilum TaxID=3039283 RepID=UPI002A4FF7E1|nr:arsenite efflux transporter metallochaperone ArsD [Chitinispirillales bacterium ANBcel5]